jgi:D-3-phosphoglycerate dehydrogenase / 2-oxoglutarate reductase
MTKVVVLEDWNHFFVGVPSLEDLSRRVEVDVQHDVPRDQADVIERLRGAQLVVLNRERTRVDAAAINALPDLELIVQTGGISSNVDRAAADAHGIGLATGPGIPNSIEGVAELALGLLLSVARQIPRNDHNVRTGQWEVAPTPMLAGGTAGIIGLGRLGKNLTRLCQALQMDVLAWGPTLTPERAAESNVRYAALDDLMAQSDAIFVCTRLSDLTRGVVTRRHIGLMKPTAYLVNAARGPIVDEAALVEALQARRIGGAGLDVFGREPLPLDSPLVQLDNVVLTPHIGWVIDRNVRAFVDGVVASIERYLEGDTSQLVNRETVAARAATR